MKIMREIAEQMKGDGGEVLCTVLGGGGYFQNVRRILELRPELILLGGKRGRVRVEGESLSLGRCFQGDVTVRGKILRIEREE